MGDAWRGQSAELFNGDDGEYRVLLPFIKVANARRPEEGEIMDIKLEVVVLPVADVDRAKRFYGSLGCRLDADFAAGEEWRLVQMTPPGSPCSIMFGKGFTPPRRARFGNVPRRR
jgi:hypothetical protein